MSKNIKIFIGLMLFTLIGLFGMGNVSADTRVNYHRCSYPLKNTEQFVLKNVTVTNTMDHFTAYNNDRNKRIVYCIQHGVQHVNSESDLSGPDYVSCAVNVNSSYVDRALVYGYSGSDSSDTPACSTDRAATQLMVWIAAKADEAGASVLTGLSQSSLVGMTNSEIGAKAYALKQLIVNHNVIPSFAKATEASAANDEKRMELKYNETNRNFSNSETDSKGVLSTWTKGTDPSGITSSISGNTLTITSKNDSVTTPLSFTKTFKTGGTGYIRGGTTWKGTLVQGTEYIEPKSESMKVYTGYKYQKIGKGIVKIHKIDKYTGKNMKGAYFGIYSDADCTKKAVDYLGRELPEKKSDKNGLIAWDNLYYPLELGQSRTYYVKETKTIEGYALDNEQLEKLKAKGTCIPVQVTASEKDKDNTAPASTTKEVEDKEVVVQAVYNIPYGNITILKQDADTGKVIPGVEFKLLKNNTKKEPATDMNGNVVKNVVTDENGIAEFENIPYGDYILVEVKADSWYKILEEPIEFTLNKDNDALKYEAQGTEALPSTGSNDNTKQDATKNNTTSDKNGSSTTNSGTTTDNKTTDKAKDILLPLAKYRLGDPTNDGKINQDDMKVIEDIIAKNIEATSLQFYASDLNLDKAVNQTDKDLMQKYLDGDKTAIANALKEYEIPGQVQKRVTLVVTNKPLDMKISKVAITNEKELPGAKIVIKNSKGEVFLKYTSTSKVKEFYIPVGDYTLTETVAPKGYQTLKTEIKFRVLSNGNIKLVSADSNMYKIVKSKEKDDTDADHLKIYNQLKKISVPNTGSVIAISTIVGGLLLIGGGSYVIYRKYKTN